MPYTLKVDWSRDRIEAVNEALKLDNNAVPAATRKVLRDALDLDGYLAEDQRTNMEEYGATIKVDLSPELLDRLEFALESALRVFEQMMLPARDNMGGRSYDELAAMQTQAWAAGRDIRVYRAAVADTQR